MKRFAEFALLVTLQVCLLAGQGVITTITGGAIPVVSSVPATNAPLGNIGGICSDNQGAIYFSDVNHNQVYRVGSDGIIRTIAGNGIAAFSGDGGSATAASLNDPSGLAADTAGNVFIIDSHNNRIRKVSPSGIITTFAGNGQFAYGGDGGPAVAASFEGPVGLAIDAAGNLYVADNYNQRVRKISPSGLITTVAGNGAINYSGDGGPATAASFISLSSIAVDSNGNIFVSDTLNQRVRKISNTGVMTTVAGTGSSGSSSDGGPAALAQLNYPTGLAVDRSGNLFIVESNGFRVRKVSTSGTISTVAGSGFNDFLGDGGPALSASFYNPYALAIDPSGN